MNALISVFGICMLLFVLLPLYTSFRVDKTRQSLFAVRDDLFDRAVRGEISFDSEAYKTTRLILNGLIRFTHRASVLRVWLMIKIGVRKSEFISREIEAAFNASNDQDRQLCTRVLFEANKVCAMHFATSPFGMLIVARYAFSRAAAHGVGLIEGLVNSKKSVFALIDREAYAEAKPCN